MKKLTDQDSETKSTDIVAENITELKLIFPDAFEEGKINFEILKQLLGGVVDEQEEKYGLNYDPYSEMLMTVGVSEALELAMRAIINPGDEIIIPSTDIK